MNGSRVAPLFEAWEDVTSVFVRGLGPLVDLAIRLWLAQIFFVSGILKTTNWDVTVSSTPTSIRCRGSTADGGRHRHRHRADLRGRVQFVASPGNLAWL